MRVRAEGLVYRVIDAAATARVRLTGLAYGDQGLFVRRQTFERVGGFPPLRLMEDVYISKALRRLGRGGPAPSPPQQPAQGVEVAPPPHGHPRPLPAGLRRSLAFRPAEELLQRP